MEGLLKRVKYEMRRVWWHTRRILNLGVQYTIVRWNVAVGGRVGLVSTLRARKWSPEHGWEDLGLLGIRCVTDAFVAFLVDCMQSSSALIDDFKYHDCGTGTNVEAAGDTALQTPSGMARVVGTQVEGSGAHIYKSVATVTSTISAATAITEHGLFNANSGPTLMDRTKFAAINLEIGNKIEFTYQLSVIAGG